MTWRAKSVVALAVVLSVTPNSKRSEAAPQDPAAAPKVKIPPNAQFAQSAYASGPTSVRIEKDGTTEYPLAGIKAASVEVTKKVHADALDKYSIETINNFLKLKPVQFVVAGVRGTPGYGIYLYRDSDGELINTTMLLMGAAQLGEVVPDSEMGDDLKIAQVKAKAKKVGRWASEDDLDALVKVYEAREAEKRDREKQADEKPRTTRQIVKQYAVPAPIRIGSIYYIHSDASVQVVGATDIFAYQDIWKFKTAKDDKGLEDLIKSERVFRIPEDTMIKAIKGEKIGNLNGVEVRVMDGQLEGKLLLVSPYTIFLRREVEANSKKRR